MCLGIASSFCSDQGSIASVKIQWTLYWSYWWLYKPSESTGSEPVIYRTCSFAFFTVYHHVDILGLNELLFSFPPVLELQHPSPAHIIDALLGIITNPNVEYGDNIVIYFSGHGSYYQHSEFDDNEHGELGYVEALCPIDRDTLVLVLVWYER